MRERREKGVILIIAIILLCLFLIFSFGKPPEMSLENSQVAGDVSDLINSDISVTDSPGEARMENEVTPVDEITFLMDNLSFERRANTVMTWIFAAILVLYLIVIGPVSYFYLKKIGKMERMWVIIPIASLLFGCFILLFSNAYTITEPQADVLAVVSPGEKSICYAVSTSPGEETYRLSFDESVESLQTLYMNGSYEIDEMNKELILHPDYVFEKDYFQFVLTEVQTERFSYVIQEKEKMVSGTFHNGTGRSFSHVMLCFGEAFCVLPNVENGVSFEVTEEKWSFDEYGMDGDLKNDLVLQKGLSKDEEQILNYAWYRYVTDETDGLSIIGIYEECETGMEAEGVDMISYGLFYQRP